MAEREIPEASLERLSESVRDALDQMDRKDRVDKRAQRRGLGWSVAASLLLAAALTGVTLTPQTETASTENAPVFELLSSPGQAQVVDLSVGEVQITMIFDEAIDL